jgi:6-phosphogluconolactonase
MTTIVYAGSYTEGPGAGEGIYVFRFDRSNGKLVATSTAGNLVNPSFLAFHPRRHLLYAVNESKNLNGGTGGSLTSFAVEGRTGKLEKINAVPTEALPCYLSVHPRGNLLFEANYSAGSAAAYAINEDGSLGACRDIVHHRGSSVDPERQRGPRAHAAVIDPFGRHLLVPDLGIDRVHTYRIDPERGKLAPAASLVVAPGAGPRHLVFHPNRPFAYLLTELTSKIIACRYDAKNGALEPLQTIATLRPDFRGKNYAADVHVHPAGTLLFCSNRGEDSIASFRIDARTGRLSYLRSTPSGGSWPRNFAIDRAGEWLLAANQKSGTIASFRIDSRSGELQETGHQALVPAAAFICFSPHG